MYIDNMSIADYKSNRLDKNQARKLVRQILAHFSDNINFSSHAILEMEKDDLTTIDILNVLKSLDSRILDEGELVNGSYRYRLETSFLMVVIAFHQNGKGIIIVTVWDKRKKESKI